MRERAQHFDPRQIMQQQDFEIFHYKDPVKDDLEVHHHDFYEIYLFLGGDVKYWVDGHILHLEPGDLLLINPMELHRPMVKPDCDLYERIVLWIDKNYLDSLSTDEVNLSRCFDNTIPTHSNLLRPSGSSRTQIMARMGELIREYYSKEYGSHTFACGILLQLLVELNRVALHNTTTAEPEQQKELSPLISQVLSHINDHYHENLSLEGLATQFFVSKYHLSHEFNKAVGVGVYRYIMLKRLLIAKQLLTEGQPPGEVYGKCGFGDYTTFFRAFKAEYGISPGACVPKR